MNLEYGSPCRIFEVQVAGTLIQVSRPKKKALLDALNNYKRGEQVVQVDLTRTPGVYYVIAYFLSSCLYIAVES